MQSSSLLRGRHCLSRLRRRLPSTLLLSPKFALSAVCNSNALSPCIADSSACLFSSASNNPQQQQSASSSASPPPVFKYPKAQDLFERITAKCSKEDVSVIAEEINTILGRTLRKNEFFYHGFGGRKVKGGKGGKAGDDIEAEEEAVVVPVKTTFDLKLVGFDATAKIKVIKEIRAIAGLGLKEAKEMVESAPKVIQKDLKPEQAQELKAKLEEIGAQIELV